MEDSEKADQDVCVYCSNSCRAHPFTQVRNATRRLHEEVVPVFARFVEDELAKSASITAEPLRVQLQTLVTEMHRRGYVIMWG